ncbi:MAG: riboflavin biosynthesis protein RibF, partial [Candidatus Omnitrophota bacterium]
MKIIYGLEKVKKSSNAVVVLGVFDGVHLAHRRILKEAVRKARAIKQRSILVTFWPHPQKEE